MTGGALGGDAGGGDTAAPGDAVRQAINERRQRELDKDQALVELDAALARARAVREQPGTSGAGVTR